MNRLPPAFDMMTSGRKYRVEINYDKPGDVTPSRCDQARP